VAVDGLPEAQAADTSAATATVRSHKAAVIVLIKQTLRRTICYRSATAAWLSSDPSGAKPCLPERAPGRGSASGFGSMPSGTGNRSTLARPVLRASSGHPREADTTLQRSLRDVEMTFGASGGGFNKHDAPGADFLLAPTICCLAPGGVGVAVGVDPTTSARAESGLKVQAAISARPVVSAGDQTVSAPATRGIPIDASKHDGDCDEQQQACGSPFGRRRDQAGADFCDRTRSH
jgi:hypothetical protein